jgi:preprotein translocase subunit SecE
VAQISPAGSSQSDSQRPGEATGLAGAVAQGSAPPAEPSDADTPEQGGFFAATMGELRKVVWPSRQQLFSESIAVILMVGVSAASIAALDRFYRWVSLQVFPPS